MGISASVVGRLTGQLPRLGAGTSVPRIMTNTPGVFGTEVPYSGPAVAAANVVNFGRSGASVLRNTGRHHVLQQMQARPDPLMNYNWYVSMPSINPLNRKNYDLSWEYVEEATLPFIEFEQVTHYRAGKNFHFPHHISLGTLSLKFYEDRLGTATTYLNAWQMAIANQETGLVNFPQQYLRPIQVVILDVAQRSVMVLDYTRCWPMRFDAVNLSSSESGRVVMGAEFSTDGVNIKIGSFTLSEMPSVMSTIGANFPDMPPALPDVFPSNFTNFSY